MSIREQEHFQLPIPNGWFAVAYSHDLREGEVKPIHYFGEDLVLFRTRENKARVIDAYCPHLGAHIGYGGRVMGETVRCPFHGWQFDGQSGECSKIPYCDTIPPRAKVRAWETQEKNGLIFVWHHVEGKPPEWDFPVLPEIGHEDWSEPRVFDLEMEAHVQDTHENNNDPVHFHYVHGAPDTPPGEIHYTPGTTHYQILNTSTQETPFGTFEVTLRRDCWGLGLVAVRSEGFGDAGLLLYSATTPIDGGRVHSRWLLTCTKDAVDFMGEEFISNITSGVDVDMPIWKNKVHRVQPVLCAEDTYLAEFRKWSRQFYCEGALERT